jgi:hypothetical protein
MDSNTELRERLTAVIEPYTDKLVIELVTYGKTGQPVRLPLPSGISLLEAVTRFVIAEHRRQTNALLDEILAELPENAGNALIQEALQQGKPQQAASYNSHDAALNAVRVIITKHKTPEGEKSNG